MRLSADKTDPGYSWYLRHLCSVIFLDGEKQRFCLTADDEQGFIVRYKADAKGNLVVDLERGEIVREKVFGRVKIVLRQRN